MSVVTDYVVSASEESALTRDFTYATRSRYTPNPHPSEANIAAIQTTDARTVSEAIQPTTTLEAGHATTEEVGTRGVGKRRLATSSSSSTSALVLEGHADPCLIRRLLSRGLAVPVQVRMTPYCGWGLFTTQAIARGERWQRRIRTNDVPDLHTLTGA